MYCQSCAWVSESGKYRLIRERSRWQLQELKAFNLKQRERACLFFIVCSHPWQLKNTFRALSASCSILLLCLCPPPPPPPPHTPIAVLHPPAQSFRRNVSHRLTVPRQHRSPLCHILNDFSFLRVLSFRLRRAIRDRSLLLCLCIVFVPFVVSVVLEGAIVSRRQKGQLGPGKDKYERRQHCLGLCSHLCHEKWGVKIKGCVKTRARARACVCVGVCMWGGGGGG